MIFVGAASPINWPRYVRTWNDVSGNYNCMDLAQGSDFSVTPKQGEFTKNLQPLPATPKLRAVRRQSLSVGDSKLRACKLGELCWVGTASRPDICARLARSASRINSLQGSDVYRINDLFKTAKLRLEAAVLQYESYA